MVLASLYVCLICCDLRISLDLFMHLIQVYDMTFELNEVEARQEEYPSTLSYLKLLNVLIAQESHTTDKGSR